MTFALQNAILYPERHPGVDPTIDFSQPLDLSFQPPSMDRYPCLKTCSRCSQGWYVCSPCI